MGKGVVKPEEVVRTVKRENELFRGNMHQDAHEFLGWMLNKIAEEVEELEKGMGKEEREEREKKLGALKRYGMGMGEGSGKSLVHQLFEGLLTNETRCLTCETVSRAKSLVLGLLNTERWQSFLFRPLPVTNLSSTCPSISNKTRPSPRACDNSRPARCCVKRTSFSVTRVVGCKRLRRGESCGVGYGSFL